MDDKNMLNCLTPNLLKKSLSTILSTNTDDIDKFIISQRFRVKQHGNRWDYDNLDLNSILSFFNVSIEELTFDSITVSHIAAILDKESFFKHGMLSLKALFATENTFISFLAEHGVTLEVEEEKISIYVHEKKMSTDYLDYRVEKDQCINGFMFGDDPENDRNISNIKRCPEIVSHIGRELLRDSKLEDEWIKCSTPSVITLKVKIDEIDPTTFPWAAVDDTGGRSYLLLKAFERLLFINTNYPSDNPMIYLKETASISADCIFDIRKIRK
ncbi:hypothetical protein [Paenibacillus alvei]|uniref:hypothetical protein n=1 Tax=Paenibacillus alvei TaxID=44250 RepID=UPI00227FCB5F|nr:hypothetical protein [Paenibacillus alvei]